MNVNGTWFFSAPNPKWTNVERLWYLAMLLSYVAEKNAETFE